MVRRRTADPADHGEPGGLPADLEGAGDRTRAVGARARTDGHQGRLVDVRLDEARGELEMVWPARSSERYLFPDRRDGRGRVLPGERDSARRAPSGSGTRTARPAAIVP